MPVNTTYPGVYLEELPSAVRSIVGVGTSTAAFVGYTARGLDHHPTHIFGFADFERLFGGLDSDSLTSYAVWQYFTNGGTDAYVVRVPKVGAAAASVTAKNGDSTSQDELVITALSSGTWGNAVIVDVDHEVPPDDGRAYNLTVTDLVAGTSEYFANVTNDSTKPNYVEAVVNDAASGSRLVEVAVAAGDVARPAVTGTISGELTIGTDPLGLTGKSLRVTVELSDTDLVELDTGELLGQGVPEPQSMSGLCNLLEARCNAAVPATRPGVRLRCTPLGTSIRVQASVSIARDQRVDAPVRISDPSSGGPSAVGALRFGSADLRGTTVSHYLLGSGRTTDSQTGGVPGTRRIRVARRRRTRGLGRRVHRHLRPRPGRSLQPAVSPGPHPLRARGSCPSGPGRRGPHHGPLCGVHTVRTSEGPASRRSAGECRHPGDGSGLGLHAVERQGTQRRRLLPADAGGGPSQRFPSALAATGRGRRRAHRPDRLPARGVEGACRYRGIPRGSPGSTTR